MSYIDSVNHPTEAAVYSLVQKYKCIPWDMFPYLYHVPGCAEKTSKRKVLDAVRFVRDHNMILQDGNFIKLLPTSMPDSKVLSSLWALVEQFPDIQEEQHFPGNDPAQIVTNINGVDIEVCYVPYHEEYMMRKLTPINDKERFIFVVGNATQCKDLTQYIPKSAQSLIIVLTFGSKGYAGKPVKVERFSVGPGKAS